MSEMMKKTKGKMHKAEHEAHKLKRSVKQKMKHMKKTIAPIVF